MVETKSTNGRKHKSRNKHNGSKFYVLLSLQKLYSSPKKWPKSRETKGLTWKGYNLEEGSSSLRPDWLVQDNAETLKTSEHWGFHVCWILEEPLLWPWRSAAGHPPTVRTNTIHSVSRSLVKCWSTRNTFPENKTFQFHPIFTKIQEILQNYQWESPLLSKLILFAKTMKKIPTEKSWSLAWKKVGKLFHNSLKQCLHLNISDWPNNTSETTRLHHLQ